MKILNNSRSRLKEIILWFGIVFTTMLLFYSYFYFDFTAPVQAIVWIAWFLITISLGIFTSKGSAILIFAQNARIELQKIIWPTREETIQTTSIVMIMVVITSFVLWMMDFLMMWVIAKLTHLG